MTDNEIRRLWVQMGNYWRQFAVPEDAILRGAMLDDWRPFLADVAFENGRAAVVALGAEPWPPPPGVIRLRALESEGVADSVPDLDVAWREVQTAVRRIGQAGLPEWSHPAVAETVGSVGWRNLCMAAEGDAGVFRQFREFYGLAGARHRAAIAPGPMLVLDGSGHPRGLGSGTPA